jgi:hypothetical protein
MGDKNPQHTSFGREVKQELPHRKVLRNAEFYFRVAYRQKYSARTNSHFFVHSSCLLPDDSVGRIANELW